jgi:hypothetical protein
MSSTSYRPGIPLGVIGAALVLVLSGVAAPASGATPSTISVCHKGCDFTGLASALAAAKDGDQLRVGPGRYAGGVTIARSVSLVGSGIGRTVITGTGDTSVLTVGVAGAASEPSVSIRGVTVTGGRVRTGPESVAFVGAPGIVAEGGGIEVPFGAGFSKGATLVLTDVEVSGNRVAPRTSAPLGPPCPSGSPCPFAEAAGGGINNWGDLTLNRVIVRDNRVGTASGLSDLASDANAGGIMSRLGSLVIRHSDISGNVATATAPNGRFADSGGIFVESGAIRLSDDTVSDNVAALSAALPASVDLDALGGGLHIGKDAIGDVRSTRVTGNRAGMTNSVGDANASSGGLHSDVLITVIRLIETGNSVSGTTTGTSTGNATVDSGGGEIGGTIADSSISGNRALARSVAGDAQAYAGGTILEGTASHSSFLGNRVRAVAPHGVAQAGGGAVVAAGATTLTRSSVSSNHVTATGAQGWARGGGLFAMLTPQGPPAGPLLISDTAITRNIATGLQPSGGGVFATTDYPLSPVRSVVAHNRPDDVRAPGAP